VGKTSVIIQIIKLLSNGTNPGRILVVTKSDNQLDYLFEKLDPKYLIRFGGFRGYREVEDNDKIIKGNDLSPSGQVDKILKRRLKLLKMIRQFAEYCKYTIFQDFTCERAAIMYNTYIIPNQKEFLKQRAETEESKNTVEEWEKYPFRNFVKEFLYPDTEGPIFVEDSNENLRRVNAYWEYIRTIFDEVQEYSAFELIREQKEREKYVISKFSKVVGVTSSFLIINQDLPTYGLNYDTIIFENGNSLTNLEKFLALNLQKDNSKLKRIIISGKVKNIKFSEICLSGSNCDAIVRRNPTIHMIPIDGEVNEPIPGVFQNLPEAQFIFSIYNHLRKSGEQKFRISILTLSEGQVELLRDMVRNNEQSWYETIGNPKVIAHVDDYEGQENEVILISIAKHEFEDKERLYQMLKVAMTRASKTIYCVGNFESVFKMNPDSIHLDLHNLHETLPNPELKGNLFNFSSE